MGNPPPTTLQLGAPLQSVHGIAKRRAMLFGRLDVHTTTDLLRHLPMRYERELAEGAIGDLPMEAVGSARGVVVAVRGTPARRGGRSRFEVRLQDHGDTLTLTWFNAGYLRDKIHPGMTLRVTGKVSAFGGQAQIINPRWEALDVDDDRSETALDDRLRPIYPATEDLNSRQISEVIARVLPDLLPQIVDPLPESLREAVAMPKLADAYRMAHQPADEEQAAGARRRLAFNELLLMQMGIAAKRHFNRHELKAPALRWNEAIDRHIRARFGFELTESQAEVVKEIAGDLQLEFPMNRLVQGDVGSGKTVVALYALLMAVADRKQGALMAPTELLAEQHYQSISAMLEGSNVRLALLTASVGSAADRRAIVEQLAAGEIDIIIGTHSLVGRTVRYRDLAVVVVDEQHRFGVLQRAAFRERAGESAAEEQALLPLEPREEQGFAAVGEGDDAAAAERGASDTSSTEEAEATEVADADDDTQGDRVVARAPHYLVMTATPIPRTLSLTVFGDLDVSTIRGLPPGRRPVSTRVLPPARADEAYDYLAQRLERGEQGYVVAPLIEDSPDSDLTNVTDLAARLKDRLPEATIEAMHGRIDSAERDAIMGRFRENQTQLLVATTVIEVGVDVPNATMIVIEHAERFGLAQLHQLRGRVGRGTTGSTPLCVLIADPATEGAGQRMEAIAATTDGFRIAEEDLLIRGVGDFFGTRQHGVAPLRVARIPEDLDLLRLARRHAIAMVDADPHLQGDEVSLLRKLLLREYGQTLGLIDVG